MKCAIAFTNVNWDFSHNLDFTTGVLDVYQMHKMVINLIWYEKGVEVNNIYSSNSGSVYGHFILLLNGKKKYGNMPCLQASLEWPRDLAVSESKICLSIYTWPVLRPKWRYITSSHRDLKNRRDWNSRQEHPLTLWKSIPCAKLMKLPQLRFQLYIYIYSSDLWLYCQSTANTLQFVHPVLHPPGTIFSSSIHSKQNLKHKGYQLPKPLVHRQTHKVSVNEQQLIIHSHYTGT